MPAPPIIIPKTKKIKLLSQGTYGCVYNPGPSCPKSKLRGNFVTKIQNHSSTSARETEIGKKITKITSYKQYFAPITESCTISLSSIDNEELNKCEFLSSGDKVAEYESNRIPYVGKDTLADSLKSRTASNKNAKLFIAIFIDSHMVLLDALEKLFAIGIIDFDLKQNNIMCRDYDGRPIIIDFGLSLDVTNFDKPGYDFKDSFFSYGPEYGPWCIDIAILCYMSNELGTDWQTKEVTMLDLERIVTDYITQNYGMVDLFTETERREYKTQLMQYLQPFDKQTWKKLADELLQWKASWDNYSLAIIYLYLMQDLHLEQYTDNFDYIHNYKKLLQQIVMALPKDRFTAPQTKEKMHEIFDNITKPEKKAFGHQLIKDFKQENNFTERQKKIASRKLAELHYEKKFKSRSRLVAPI